MTADRKFECRYRTLAPGGLRWRGAGAFLACAVALLGGLGACSPVLLPGDGSPHLWELLGGCSSDVPDAQRLDCVRVRVSPSPLRAQADRLSLALPDSKTIVLRKTPDLDIPPVPGAVSWRGTIVGEPFSSAAFAMVEDAVSGRVVTSEGRVYRLGASRIDGPIVERLDPARLPPEVPPPGPLPPAGPLPHMPEPWLQQSPWPPRELGSRRWLVRPCDAPGPTVICVLVVYTPQAAGGTKPNLLADIALAVIDTNVSFAKSGVANYIHFAGSRQVNEDESGNLLDDLGRLQGTSDEFWDDVHLWRNDTHADLVVLVTDYPDLGSLAYEQFGAADLGNQGFASNAFAIVPRRLLVNAGYAFAHELGHLMGAAHSGMAMGGFPPGPFCYSHAHVDPVPGEVDKTVTECPPGTPVPPRTPVPPWMTIMQGDGTDCPGCTVQPYWSSGSDTLSFCGRPLGNPYTEDNARTLNETADTVATFR